MKFRAHCIASVIALVAAGAIVVHAGGPFTHGLIQTSCAPWDGPAIQLTLTTTAAECNRISGPYLSLGVWKGLPLHDAQVVTFNSGSNSGFASRCNKAGDCQRAESGSIVFEKYDEGAGARGRYELHFKGGDTLSGSFDVPWCKTQGMCG